MTGLALAAVSYSLNGAAEATGIGRTNIAAAIRKGDLTAHWMNTKPIILAADLAEWIGSLPTEKAS